MRIASSWCLRATYFLNRKSAPLSDGLIFGVIMKEGRPGTSPPEFSGDMWTISDSPFCLPAPQLSVREARPFSWVKEYFIWVSGWHEERQPRGMASPCQFAVRMSRLEKDSGAWG